MKAVIMFLLLSGVVMGQTDTIKISDTLYRYTDSTITFYKARIDTTEAELLIASENYYTIVTNGIIYKKVKMLFLIDGYVVRDRWMAREPIYLDADKKPLNMKVYLIFGK